MTFERQAFDRCDLAGCLYKVKLSLGINKKVKKFIALNVLLQPIGMILGLLSSVLVVRRLGPEYYGVIVALNAFINTISYFTTLGISATVTKMWIDFDDPRARDGVLLLAWLVQIVSLFVMIIIYNLYSPLVTGLMGGALGAAIPSWGMAIIVVSVCLSSVISSVLIAELNNKVTLTSSLFSSIANPVWLIYATCRHYSLSAFIAGIIILHTISALILLVGGGRYIGRVNWANAKYIFRLDFLSKFMGYYGTICILSLFKYFSGLSFIAIVLNHREMLSELAYLSIIMKIIGIIMTFIGIPTSKVAGVLFAQAFKNGDEELTNKIYNYIIRYFILTSTIVASGMFYFGEYFIERVYSLSVTVPMFNWFYFSAVVGMLLGVANWVIQYNEHYKVALISSLVGIIYTVGVLVLFVPQYGLLGVLISFLGNHLIFGGTSFVYTHYKYKGIRFPVRHFMGALGLLVLALHAGAIWDNNLFSSVLSLTVFGVTFIILFRPDDFDKMIIRELVPVKMARYIPSRYTM